MNPTFFAISTALCAADELKPAIDKMIEDSTWESLVFERTEFAHHGDGVCVKFVYRQTARRGSFSVTGGQSVTPALRHIEDSDSSIANVDVEFGNEFGERLGHETDEDEHGYCGRLYNTLKVRVDFVEGATATPVKRKRTDTAEEKSDN